MSSFVGFIYDTNQIKLLEPGTDLSRNMLGFNIHEFGLILNVLAMYVSNQPCEGRLLLVIVS